MIKAYLNRLALGGYRPNTIAVRERCLRAFAADLDPHQITSATRAQIEAYLARPLAPESRRAYRAHLRGFFAYCLEEGIVADDPTERVPPIRVPKATPRPISGDQLALALDAAGPRMRAWLLLMALGGLRCVEVSLLRPCDLFPTDEGTLLFLRETKGGGNAVVPAHHAVLEALAVLPVRNGLWWSVQPNNVGAAVAAHLRGLGIEATAHALRHTAGTSWYRASGHDVLTTATLLRHASIATTQVYAALDPTRPAAVVRLVEVPARAAISAKDEVA